MNFPLTRDRESFPDAQAPSNATILYDATGCTDIPLGTYSTMSERSLLEELAASITEQVQLVVKSLEPSQLPHLHEAKPSSLLDDFYPPQPAFNAFQKIITDAQTLVSLLQPSKIQLLNIALSGAENQALRVAVEWGIADAIEDAGGSIELSKLSKLYKTDEHKLGSLLRLYMLMCRLHIASPYQSTYLC